MWQLSMIKKDARDWAPVGLFATLREAARQIIVIEGSPGKGLFFEVHVETDYGTDAEALGYLEYSGRAANYVVKRSVQ
jgi:hypothetical protein